MHFALYILRLVAPFAVSSSISSTVLNIASDTSVTDGLYHKLIDLVGCAPEYGENLGLHACHKALQTLPDGSRFSQYVLNKSYPGQTAVITPVYYYDNSSEASCVITVDLAGWSSTDDSVYYIRRRFAWF